MPEYVPPVGDEPGVWIFWPSTHCLDYGHHGRERCVVCGLPNPEQYDGPGGEE